MNSLDVIGIKYIERETVENALKEVELAKYCQYKLVSNLDTSRDWCMVVLKPIEKETDLIIIPDSLLKELSKILQTMVVFYQTVSIVGAYSITAYKNGSFEDSIEILDYEASSGTGFFNDVDGEIDGEEEICNILERYFDHLDFNPALSIKKLEEINSTSLDQ